MDSVSKFLSRVDQKEGVVLANILSKIISGKLDDFDIKKLTGNKETFRVRKGKFRIIFKKVATHFIIISVNRRSEKTYRDF